MLIATLIFGGYIPNTLRPLGRNWAAYFGLLCSFSFAAISFVTGTRIIRHKGRNLVDTIIAVIGSAIIILVVIGFAVIDAIISNKGLPG